MMTEQEMQEAKVPWPKTLDELTEYILTITEQGNGYGTAAYATSMAATATFNYMSHVLGLSGFQASCADLDLIRRTRDINGPFSLVYANDLLYPQTDPLKKVMAFLQSCEEWVVDEAKKKLKDDDSFAVKTVTDHWEKLVEGAQK